MPMWNPWRGCKKCSEGCLHCYIHKGDAKRGVDTSQIVKTSDFDKPVRQLKKGGYKMKPGLVYLGQHRTIASSRFSGSFPPILRFEKFEIHTVFLHFSNLDLTKNLSLNQLAELCGVALGFSTDFLIEEADAWRGACWKMIKERSDCTFLFLTKRIERFSQCIPEDWADGYENVTVCCTIETQRSADKKLSVFQGLPIKHRCITAQPLIERVHLEPYLDGVELVVVGGESDRDARPLDYRTFRLNPLSCLSGTVIKTLSLI